MKLFQSNPPQKDASSLALNINLGSSKFSQVVQNPFAQKPNEIQWSQQNQQSRQQSRLYADYSNASSNDDFMNYQNGGFGSFKQSILQNHLEEDFSPLNESKEISINNNNNSNNNSSSTSNSGNNNNGMNKSGPSSMQIMSSQLSTTEKATILLCLILGQFQNNNMNMNMNNINRDIEWKVIVILSIWFLVFCS